MTKEEALLILAKAIEPVNGAFDNHDEATALANALHVATGKHYEVVTATADWTDGLSMYGIEVK